MAKTIRIKLPSIEQVEFILSAEEEEIPVRGNALDSGDIIKDRMYENDIIRRLDMGDVWAWASVEVKARYKCIESDSEYLGGCSYKDEKDFIKNSGYYEDMRQVCYESLIAKIKALSI